MSIAAESTTYSVPIVRRRRLSFNVIAHVAALVDFLVVLTSSVAGVFLHHHLKFGLLTDPAMNVGVGLLTAVIFVLAMSCMQAYRYEALSSPRHQILLVSLLFATVLAFILAIVFFLKLGDTFSRGAVLNLAALSMLGLIGVRLLWYRRLSRAVAGGWLRPRRAFFICPQELAAEKLQRFSETGAVRIAQMAVMPENDASAGPLYERLSKIDSFSGIDEIVVIWRDGRMEQLEGLLLRLRQLPLPVKVVFDSFTGSVVSCQPEHFSGLIAFQVQSSPLGPVERTAKRGFDILFSIVALIILAPMLLLVAIAIKLDSTGPALFIQRRLGHGNQPFRIIKFRSMTVLEDGETIRQATSSDARVTRVGAFIRAYSIDELPQFLNVLRGDMSVVGPRPHAVAHDNIYDPLITEYASRRHVKPGVTGWAQVQGFRGETPTVDLMERRVQHDRWYIDNWSLWLDTKIVIRTLFALRGI